MEKQIKEIANIMCRRCPNKCDDTSGCIVEDYAEAIYNAGYRKQAEGEWLCIYLNKFEHLSKHKCSECGFVNTARYNYCPNCGAKMKGEKDEKQG